MPLGIGNPPISTFGAPSKIAPVGEPMHGFLPIIAPNAIAAASIARLRGPHPGRECIRRRDRRVLRARRVHPIGDHADHLRGDSGDHHPGHRLVRRRAARRRSSPRRGEVQRGLAWWQRRGHAQARWSGSLLARPWCSRLVAALRRRSQVRTALVRRPRSPSHPRRSRVRRSRPRRRVHRRSIAAAPRIRTVRSRGSRSPVQTRVVTLARPRPGRGAGTRSCSSTVGRTPPARAVRSRVLWGRPARSVAVARARRSRPTIAARRSSCSTTSVAFRP